MRGWRAWRTVGSTAVAVLFLGACVGSVSRETFDDEVHARGGGLDQQLVLDAVAALREELGVEQVQFRSITTTPGQVVMDIRVPGSLDDVDVYRFGSSGMYGGGGLSDPDPQHRSGDTSLEGELFLAEDAELEGMDAVVDQAREEAGLAGGYASGLSITRSGSEPEVVVTVDSERRTVTVTFAADGTLVGVAP